jgi:hypothetical protein
MAHHAGVERQETLGVLRKLDRQLARLAAAARLAPRPVQFVVLSDHGQTQGATFLQRYGATLEALVVDACETSDVETAKQGDEAWMYLGASMTEASGGGGAAAKGLRKLTNGRRVDDTVALGPASDRAPSAGASAPEIVVMASGNLGLISFPHEPGRVSLERIEERYPRLLSTLRSHPGIGFALVRSERHGAVVLGAAGTNYLDEERVIGTDPLAPFGPNAARHVRRTDGFEHCADVMVNSTFWPDTGEVAAFEELVGSHGGLGGTQSFAFALVPSDWTLPDEPIVGAGELHVWLRRWLASLGQEAYTETEVLA